MNLNKNKIMKALEYCTTHDFCDECPIISNCHIIEDSFALIKKLYKDNERLADLCITKDVTIFELRKVTDGHDEKIKAFETELRQTQYKLNTVIALNDKLTAYKEGD